MAKKRKCRYSMTELAIHEEAVRLRRLTDTQLVEAFSAAQRYADELKKMRTTPNTSAVVTLLDGLDSGAVKGIKGATAYKVREYAAQLGLL